MQGELHVDISRDLINRELKEIDAGHRAVLSRYGAALGRLASGDSGVPDGVRQDWLSGGLSRRNVLKFGSVTVLASALFGACAGSGEKVVTAATTTTTVPGSQGDVTILRTAGSIEALAVSVYQKIIDSGLVKNAAIQTAMQLFQTQHSQHGDLFSRATTSAGGKPFNDPNPVLLQQIATPRLAALKTEADAIGLAYDLENGAAETYQSNVGFFANKTLNGTIMQVGGIEARHVAVLASAINKLVPTNGAFQSVNGAVPAGTGV
jgi:Ferritin-like domain